MLLLLSASTVLEAKISQILGGLLCLASITRETSEVILLECPHCMSIYISQHTNALAKVWVTSWCVLPPIRNAF